MKVLWLSTSKSLYKSSFNNNDYNGVGWVGALQLEIMKHKDIELAVAFISNDPNDVPDVQNGVHYYPIFKRNNAIDKLLHYHLGHRKWDDKFNVDKVQSVIADFKPDLIQSFGFECPLADIIGHTSVPVVVHIQGIINPYYNNYLPAGISLGSIYKYGSLLREFFIHNGFSYGYSNMKTLAYREKILYSKCKYACGRTVWDRNLTSLMAPQAKYFHVDELLREDFFKAPQWQYSYRKRKVIVSTISENIYKGLDLVGKTAQVLTSFTNLDFEWQIIGISDKSSLINLVEKSYGLSFKKLPIVFKGVRKSNEIVEILENADIYVHPSAIDNSPNSLCEAQLLGIPVIATNVGGVSSLLPSGTGILVPNNSPFMLSEQIKCLLNNPKMSQQLGIAGRAVAFERHDKNRVLNQLLDMYHQIKKETNE